MERPRERVSEVAVVASLRTAFYLADRASGLDNVTHVLVTQQLAELARCGAPFDMYLISELFEPSVPNYRCYVFLDTFFMTDEELARVSALRDAGRHMLFFYAPAFVSPYALSLDRMRSLLGMEVELTDSMRLPDGNLQRPGFRVPGQDGELARSGPVSYCPAPPLPARRLRELLREAGVHIYLETDDPLMVGGGYLAVHAARAGAKTLHARAPTTWTDARTGKMLAREADHLTVEMPRGQTLLLSLQS